MVWDFISASDAMDLVKIDRITNAEKYGQILIHHVKLIFNFPRKILMRGGSRLLQNSVY